MHHTKNTRNKIKKKYKQEAENPENDIEPEDGETDNLQDFIIYTDTQICQYSVHIRKMPRDCDATHPECRRPINFSLAVLVGDAMRKSVPVLKER